MKNIESFFILYEKARDDDFISAVIESAISNFLAYFRVRTDKAVTNIMCGRPPGDPDFTDDLANVAMKSSKDSIRHINRLCKRENIPLLVEDENNTAAIEAVISEVLNTFYKRGIQSCSR